MCENEMLALIRTKDNFKVGIRATFSKLVNGKNGIYIKFSGISKLGLEKLVLNETLRFEILGMPSKVVFQTKARKIDEGVLICPMPKSLISIERRSAARSATVPDVMAYMKLSVWQPEDSNLGGPPLFPQFTHMKNWLPIFDISIGGVCLYTSFPDVLKSTEMGTVDEEATLILPMASPITIPSTVRWQRRIKNTRSEVDDDRTHLEFRLGIEFNSLEEDDVMTIKQFIRQLSVAEAI